MFHAKRPEEAADQALVAHLSRQTSHRGGSISPKGAFPKDIDGSHTKKTELAIYIDEVSKSFGNHSVLSKVSLAVPRGSIHGIMGKSGAGKTTLIRIAGLLEKPDQGSIWYEGIGMPVHELHGRAMLEARRQVGFVFQSFNLFSSRSASGNIAFPLEAAGWPREKIRARVEELLEFVELSDKANRPAGRLSGGEKQRVAIARALANSPSMLLSDEATSALDPETTRAVLDLIRSLRDRLNLTVIMVTHQKEVIRRICDTVSVISGGSIVEQGSVAEVFSNPRSEAAKAFLKEEEEKGHSYV